ncbi:GH25 family lysozyme [Christiangramia sp.]|uniref:glycoside hydrolase family 25 protein n=1 Tax=Christiangramia sp. TaxID=1931228 RepID=UPI00261B7D6B|nr:GH25 family lysozyme [Christiangramia sp.]
MEQYLYYLIELVRQNPLTAFIIGCLFLMCLLGFVLLVLSLKKYIILKNKNPGCGSKKIYKIFLTIGCLSVMIALFSGFVGKQYLPKWIFSNNSTFFIGKENTWLYTSEKSFGIDISHYQGTINWDEVNSSAHPIEYVFVRATMGSDGKDKQYERNWKATAKSGYVRGAYHYYRPNENSVLQFQNFARTVELSAGDFPPVLDIEEMGKYGKENLITGVLDWLRLAQEHYGIKPIVYTGSNFYHQYLKGHIKDYPLWIAAYSGPHRLKGINWSFHQFSDKMRIKGINSFVDGNSFKGKVSDFAHFRIQ